MTWVVWRQHRQQAIVAAAAFGAIALFLGITGPAMSHTFHVSGLAACVAQHVDCGPLLDSFDVKYNAYQFLVPLFLILPALVGIFWGAPLIAREFEQGTFRFAWTQSVSRRRWATTKIAAIAAGTIVLGVAAATMLTWWSAPLVLSHTDKFVPGIFDLLGIVPIAYALFAVALGIAFGALLGRVLPAMGATAAGFVVVRFFMTIVVRKHYLSPMRAVSSGPFGFNDAAPRGAWVLTQNTIDKAGSIVSPGGGLDFQYLSSHCPGLPAPGSGAPGSARAVPVLGKDLVFQCTAKLGLRTSSTFQPLNRFWTFQWMEFAIYVVLAAALLGFAIWRVRSWSR